MGKRGVVRAALGGGAVAVSCAWPALAAQVTSTLSPVADARVVESSPNRNYASNGLGTDGGSGARQATVLRFDLGGLDGPIAAATLRLFASGGSVDGPAVHASSGAWTEATVTWASRPQPVEPAAADLGKVSASTWVEFDVTGLVQGGGVHDLILTQPGVDGTQFRSREQAEPPRLVVVHGLACDPTPCADGNACTVDACDDAGGCSHALATVGCDLDGNACTLDACVAAAGGGACAAGPEKACADGDACTADACDAGTGTCTAAPLCDQATFIAAGAAWRYLVTGTDPGIAWRQPGFDASGWPAGKAELGYGEGDESTVIGFGPDTKARYVTTYFRHAFLVADPKKWRALGLQVRRDDGVVVYLNGVEVFRDNLPQGALTAATLATAAVEGKAWLVGRPPPGLLLAGDNVVAVEVHQASPSSSDLGLDLVLTAEADAPPPQGWLVPAGAIWNYLDSGVDPGPGWQEVGYDDTLWPGGRAPLGYGYGDEATVIRPAADPNAKALTTWFRRRFAVPDPALWQTLTVRLDRDDGAAVYLNGIEVLRNNLPAGPLAASTPALAAVEKGLWLQAAVAPALLVAGSNVLAVEVHQAAATSSDLAFDLSLGGTHGSAGFQVAVTPATVALEPGGSVDLAVVVTRHDGFAEAVLVHPVDLGPGLTATAVEVAAEATAAVMTVLAAADAPSGPRQARLQATSGDLVATTPLAVAVDAPLAPSQATIAFAGRTWQVRQAAGAPGPNAWSRSSSAVFVDGDGRLHLKVLYRDGAWTSAEVELPASLGYGTYTWTLAGPVDAIDPNLVAAAFLYQDNDHEFDVELSRWQDLGHPNAQFVIQPWHEAGHLDRFDLALGGAATSTWRLDWSPAAVQFEARVGGAVVRSWSYTGASNFEPGGERVHLNHWQVGGAAPSDGLEKDFIIADFHFEPPPCDYAACDDGNACTADGCAWAGGCSHVALAGGCDADGNACTADACSGGACVAGPVKACVDGDPCTTDACHPSSGGCVFTATCDATVLVAKAAAWRYLDDGSDPGPAWRDVGFDDGQWGEGPAQLGYGDGDEATVLGWGPDASQRVLTARFRHTFAVTDPAGFAALRLGLVRDDGAVVYLNGIEVFRSNLGSGPVTAQTPAAVAVEDPGDHVTAVSAALLLPGPNVLAVEVHQASASSSDLSFAASLEGTAQAPSWPPGTLVPAGAVWRYVDTGLDPGPEWRAAGFDDGAWPQGAAQLGYGDGDEATTLGQGTDPAKKPVTVWFRHAFAVDDPTGWQSLAVRLERDDGAAVYLNGIEVLRSNLPTGPLTAATLATNAVEDGAWTEVAVAPQLLVAGSNVLAVEVHQASASSSDLSFDLALTGTPGPVASTDPVLVGAGDIGDCGSTLDSATSALLDGIAGTVFTVGDNAYPAGSAADFANCLDPAWGRHKARMRPALGNHDYMTAGAAAYFAYFGAAAGTPGQGWYSYDVGSWHVVVLNSECDQVGCGAGSAQATWLQADLAAHPTACTLAVWHAPYYSSGPHKPPRAGLAALWQVLDENGVELLLSGHDHAYERFHAQDGQGNLDPTGIVQFIVGTGGGALTPVAGRAAHSAVRDDQTWGVLRLTLHPGAYSWRFVPLPGQVFTDWGTAACH